MHSIRKCRVQCRCRFAHAQASAADGAPRALAGRAMGAHGHARKSLQSVRTRSENTILRPGVEILLSRIFRLGGVNYGNMHCMYYVVCGIYKIYIIRTLFLHVHSHGQIVKPRAASLRTENYRCHQVLHKGGILAH